MKNRIILCFVIMMQYSFAQTPPNLGVAANYGILSADSIIATDSAFVYGNCGAVSYISSYMNADSLHLNNSRTSSALTSLANAKSFLSAQSGTSISNVLDGQSRNAGVYNISGDAILDGELTLNGDTNSIFIFNISGNLVVDSAIIYGIGNIRSSNIYWNIGGYFRISSMKFFYGNI